MLGSANREERATWAVVDQAEQVATLLPAPKRLPDDPLAQELATLVEGARD